MHDRPQAPVQEVVAGHRLHEATVGQQEVAPQPDSGCDGADRTSDGTKPSRPSSDVVTSSNRGGFDQDAAELFSLATDVLIRASHLPATGEQEDGQPHSPTLSSEVVQLVTGQGFKSCSPTNQLQRLLNLLNQVF